MSSYCNRCGRRFPHSGALDQHIRDSPKHRICCNFCDIDFATRAARKTHYDRCHYYCKICNELFDEEEDLLDHGEDEHYACRTCVRIFTSLHALANHNESSHHYCRECNRLFKSAAGLSAHRSSSVHKPRSILCPGRSCRKAFVSVSALLHHAESSACPSGVTRKVVNAFVAKIDRQGLITNSARMLTAPNGARVCPPEPDHLATERSWNGTCYKCFLCLGEFRTLDSLNQHLKSPRHLQSIYHCPMPGCSMECSVLSALCQHVEMGSCGIRATRLVQNTMESLIRSVRAIAL